jgi:hypothetical protein
MELVDPVYGPLTITSPVLLELLASPPLQRLAGISQAGFPEPTMPGTDHTRLEHSIGVCHLLARFGAGLEEQTAGLLHDVSHTAFSHCVDHALDGWDESAQGFQDAQQARFLAADPVSSILERHGIEPRALADDDRLPLLERPLPDLCADRIDYILRTGVHAGVIDASQATTFLDAIEVHDRTWVVTDAAAGLRFARYFQTINDTYYCGLPSAVMFRTVGDLLRHALRQGAIGRDDLFTTDGAVLARIRDALPGDPDLARLWRRMHGQVEVRVGDDGDVVVRCKSRAIDPWCRDGHGQRRLSELDPEWKRTLDRSSVPRVHRFTLVDRDLADREPVSRVAVVRGS